MWTGNSYNWAAIETNLKYVESDRIHINLKIIVLGYLLMLKWRKVESLSHTLYQKKNSPKIFEN